MSADADRDKEDREIKEMSQLVHKKITEVTLKTWSIGCLFWHTVTLYHNPSLPSVVGLYKYENTVQQPLVGITVRRTVGRHYSL